MDLLVQLLKDLQSRIQSLEIGTIITKLRLPNNGTFQVPKYSVDPASPADGEVWYNTTSNKYKGRENGVTKTFTTS